MSIELRKETDSGHLPAIYIPLCALHGEAEARPRWDVRCPVSDAPFGPSHYSTELSIIGATGEAVALLARS